MQSFVPIEDASLPAPANLFDLDKNQLQLILQRLPVGVLVATVSPLPMFFANEHASQLLGRSVGEGKASLEPYLYYPDSRPIPSGEFPLNRSISHGEIVTEREILYERPDGERLTLRISSVPIYDREGKITAGALILSNVTHHRRFETVARRSQHELLDFFENAVEGLHWAGPDGTLLWANKAELDLLGYAPEEYLGHNLAEFHADPGAVEDMLARLKRKEVLRDYEARLRCKDGSIKHVLIDGNVLWFEGQFIHTRCFTRDVTERKQLEQQLQRRVEELAEADRRKDEFLAILGHELRNPLAAVSAAAELMQAREVDPAGIARAREIIARQVKQMARLTDDLLDVARITYGRIELRKEKVDLAAIVERAVETVSPLFEKCDQQLLVSPCPPNVILSADPARLEQILVNLLGNAARHAGAGSRVHLDVTCLKGQATLRVRDSGVGIAHDMLTRVFEPFVRVSASGEAEAGGLGLGLTLVRKLVELHEGSVEACSEGPGRGSEFVVRLPMLESQLPNADGDSSRPHSAAGNSQSARSRRVLLVDDNKDAVVTLGEILEILGHDVCVAYSGPDAIEKAIQHRPDVVVLDIGMPGMDGYEVARRLREMGVLDDALLVAMTGYGQERDRQLSLAQGFHFHLVKPVQLDSLVALLDGKSGPASAAATG